MHGARNRVPESVATMQRWVRDKYVPPSSPLPRDPHEPLVITPPKYIAPPPHCMVLGWSTRCNLEHGKVRCRQAFGGKLFIFLDFRNKIVPECHYLAVHTHDQSHEAKTIAQFLTSNESGDCVMLALNALKSYLSDDVDIAIADRAPAIKAALRNARPGISLIPCLWHTDRDVDTKITTLIKMHAIPLDEKQGILFRVERLQDARSLEEYQKGRRALTDRFDELSWRRSTCTRSNSRCGLFRRPTSFRPRRRCSWTLLLQTDLSAEVVRATAAESANASNITAETTRASQAERVLTNGLHYFRPSPSAPCQALAGGVQPLAPLVGSVYTIEQ